MNRSRLKLVLSNLHICVFALILQEFNIGQVIRVLDKLHTHANTLADTQMHVHAHAHTHTLTNTHTHKHTHSHTHTKSYFRSVLAETKLD